jgi:hypothetical protein
MKKTLVFATITVLFLLVLGCVSVPSTPSAMVDPNYPTALFVNQTSYNLVVHVEAADSAGNTYEWDLAMDPNPKLAIRISIRGTPVHVKSLSWVGIAKNADYTVRGSKEFARGENTDYAVFSFK